MERTVLPSGVSASPSGVSRLPFGVSAREAEVLDGVAGHLTNAEIGAQLFISVRTVESHVSSLLRKFGVHDRRALAGVAATLRTEVQVVATRDAVGTRTWPTQLTSFIGRDTERAELARALATHRLVTAVGPGGIGKTRLAGTVAADVRSRHSGGAWYVDLVPVTDEAMVAVAVADALDLGEQRGRSVHDTIVSWLAERDALLVLDNCEHLMNGVVVLLDRLLASCPRLVVLATSRARLLVPYEWVFTVPGLSMPPDARGNGDAVDLFVARAMAAGSLPTALDHHRIGAICRGLDGVALAIELAAARLPGLGFDGLEAALADRLELLTGGRRIDDRHRSLRSALDWSFALLNSVEQAVLRRLSVFAAPFTADDAAAVIANWVPIADRNPATQLALLADHSLLVTVPRHSTTQYRALETVRQYALQRLDTAGERDDAHARHARWCLGVGQALAANAATDAGVVRPTEDRVADELRAALRWAAPREQDRLLAYELATCLAELSFIRGTPGESQRRYEQAAGLASTDGRAATALSFAAGAAETRHFGDQALRLHRAAADAALRAGDEAGAAGSLARIAELAGRGTGLLTQVPTDEQVRALISEAHRLGDC